MEMNLPHYLLTLTISLPLRWVYQIDPKICLFFLLLQKIKYIKRKIENCGNFLAM